MAYISYNYIWESEFGIILSAKDKVQDLYINQIKLTVDDAYKKDEKIKTSFKAVKDEDVINNAYLDKKL